MFRPSRPTGSHAPAGARDYVSRFEMFQCPD
jgi:hypothetical protein